RRQVVEVVHVEVRAGETGEQQLDVLAVVQPGRRGEAALQSELEPRWIGAGIGFAADVLESEPGGTEQLIPVRGLAEGRRLGRIHAGGEGAAHESAHAGSGREIDRNAVLLEPADDANVSDAAGAAAAERDADCRAARLADNAWRCLIIGGRR